MATSQLSESILIDYPADLMFAYVSNYENDPMWRAGVSEMTHEPPGMVHQGMRTHEVMRFMGQDWINLAEIVAYKANHQISFCTSSGLSASGSRLVKAEGCLTRFTYQVQAELTGLLGFLSPFILWAFRRRVTSDLNRLKTILENQ